MIYIFTSNSFKLTELFNNYLFEGFSYEQIKEKLNIIVIDNITDKKKFINQGFETDDIIFCLEADNSFESLKANLYFATKDWNKFINYINYIKYELWKQEIM